MTIIKIAIVTILIKCLSCQAQTYNADDCIGSLKRAKSLINNFHLNSDESLLRTALLNLDTALICPNTKMQGTELKISVLVLLKDYQTGITFTDSLKQDRFKYAYKRNMYNDYFIALQNEANGDSAKRNTYFTKAIQEIENFIKKEERLSKDLNEEAYVDLFFIKSKIMTKDEINAEINRLQKIYTKNTQFFKQLAETII